MNTNLLLNFSNVFNYNLTMCRNKMFDNNSVFDEFENILYLLKIFSNGFDKYQALLILSKIVNTVFVKIFLASMKFLSISKIKRYHFCVMTAIEHF
ncbi:MAG: hypothetical protein IJV56_01160 [Neisseriaceae bacterium]|nr:hypothetical protein [Neisseriaceae bacterium]